MLSRIGYLLLIKTYLFPFFCILLFLVIFCDTNYSNLSHNDIAAIPKRMFKGVQRLRSLQLDNNQIVCIDEQAARNLHEMEILTLNGNNLTTLPRDMFSNMPRLRALRLSDNPFLCDCHLSWLSKYLRSVPRLAPYTRCQSPSQLKGQNVADLQDQEFKCSGSYFFLFYYWWNA